MKITRYRRGQLFLIEIIVALSVLFFMVTIMFTTQTLTTPTDNANLDQIGTEIVDQLAESGILWDYYQEANNSFYVLQETLLDENNATKFNLAQSIEAVLPLISDYKAFLFRLDPTSGQWTQIDILNFFTSTPSGSDITVVEHYTPGFHGNFDQFKFQLELWYEVNI